MNIRRSCLLLAGGLLLLPHLGAWAPTASADIPEMTLRHADTFPPVGFVPTHLKAWAEEITRRTDGKVKIESFWSDSLFRQADAATNLQAGVADFARVASTYDPARTELWMTLDMPFNARDYWCGMNSSVRTAQEEPNLKGMFENLGFLPVKGYSSGHFHFLANVPIQRLEDLQGKRLRSYGGARVNMYERLRMSPIFMAYSDIYESVERGVVDGAEATILLTESFKHYEVADHMTLAHSGFVMGAPLSINMDRWNSFPDSLKQIFREVGAAHDMNYAREMMEQEEVKLAEFQEKYDMNVHTLSDEDQAALEEAGREAQEAWLVAMESKGVPARATWGEFRKLYDACESEVTEKGYPWEQR